MSISSFYRFGVCAPALLMVALSGCGDKKISYTDPIYENRSKVVRPEALRQAEADIRAGREVAAQDRVERWLQENEKSVFEAEARYLLGQALYAQGKFMAAKESHDKAIELAPDRTVKGLAILARADCNFKMKKYNKASRQLHWLEEVFRDVTAVKHDEVLFKLGMCNKMVGQTESADYWFNRVIELYATGPYAAEARRQNSKLGPGKSADPLFYALELASFSDEKTALKEADIYSQKGYKDVHVRKVSLLATNYYSVQVGQFFNKLDAKRALDDAELSGLQASIKPTYVRLPQ